MIKSRLKTVETKSKENSKLKVDKLIIMCKNHRLHWKNKRKIELLLLKKNFIFDLTPSIK